jgi:predicted DCC family thiol-disulfide oxidoreductase YuxK
VKQGDLTVLYDSDCGICQATARVLRRLDRGRRLRLVALQDAHVPGVPTLEQLLESLHAVDEEQRWWVGADAAVQIAQRVPLLRPLALLAELPLAPTLLDAGYRIVARNRHRVSRLLGLDACKVRGSTPTRRRVMRKSFLSAAREGRSLGRQGSFGPFFASPTGCARARRSSRRETPQDLNGIRAHAELVLVAAAADQDLVPLVRGHIPRGVQDLKSAIGTDAS